MLRSFFFFNDPANPEIYTYIHALSLYVALPISALEAETRYIDTVTAYDRALQQLKDLAEDCARAEKPKDDDDDDDDEDCPEGDNEEETCGGRDRKSTRLNSRH